MPKIKKIIAGAFLILGLTGIFAAPTVASASELCNDINDAVKILNCGNEDVVTFEGFQGNGLAAPSDQGLDPTLTQAKTARQFIINTVNFALTFLGVIAMVVIIYGGFLYVTAGGEEEGTTKGKKSITYAVIGILIIVASFAIVNTLLTFGGGTNTDRNGGAGGAGRGVGEEGSNIGQQVIYNLGASEINTSLNDFISAYKNLSAINTLVTKLEKIPGPTDRVQNKNYLNQIVDVIGQIKNSSNSLSKTHQVAEKMLNEQLLPWQNLSTDALSVKFGLDGAGTIFEQWHNEDKTGNQNATFGEQFPSDLQQIVASMLDTSGQENSYNLLEAAKADFTKSIDAIIGPNTPVSNNLKRPSNEEKVDGRLLIVWKIMGSVADEVTAKESLDRGFISDKDLQRAFEGIDPNITVGQLFQEAIVKIDTARSLATDPTNTDVLVDAIKSLNRLYIIVKDIKFTFVRIRASVREGSSPLVVELSGLDSRDPTGKTIADSNYEWDPDGDGENGIHSGGIGFAPVECTNESKGPTITCTYNQPGTYVVRLKIPSTDPAHIASGQAYLPITVGPSVARIGLKATVGTLTEDLRKYEKDARGAYNLVIDKNEYHVTTEEAKSTGVTFDATSSLSGNGGDLKTYAWSFGDGSQPEEGQTKNRIDSHKYTREGKFTMRLEVTDQGNRKDRKILNIVVAALAARIGVKQTISEPDTLLEFDGSLSRSDNGAINSYTWSILNKEGEDVLNFANVVSIVGDPTAAVLRVRFKQPGNYVVKLQVADGTASADTQIPVSIKSRKPRANFVVRACPTDCPDPTQPAIVELDGSQSFDPDPGDVLTYNWSFKNAVGEKLENKTGFDIIDPVNTPLSGQNVKKLRIKFRTVGKFTVSMNVNDSHTDPSILQEDTKEKVINIDSIVDASWSPTMKSVFKLTDGIASVPFQVGTRNADQIEIDFGDDQTDIQKDESGKGGYTFTHEYEKAGAYLVTIKATSEQGNGANTLTKKIYIAQGDGPLAAMDVSVNGVPVIVPEKTEDNPTPAFEIIRNKVIKFDASESIDSRGIPGLDGLKFSWSFGDGGTGTGVTIQHAYKDVSPEEAPFMVTLTATERSGDKKVSTATFPIRVNSAKPTATTLSVEKKTAGDKTPIDVEVSAEGATDPDGSVKNFQFWYYDPADKEKQLGVVDTAENHAILTVETNGEENEEHEYNFCVRLTDDDNQSTECSDMFQDEELPKLKVKNGPNKAPDAAFSPDHTDVKINDSVTFTSASLDSDGSIKQYIWDVDGDGFQNDKPTELSTISHIYTKKSPNGGYRVKLKVIDDKGAAGYSKEIPVFVSTNSNPPTAGFTYKVDPNQARRVQFFDISKADKVNSAKITKWSWDFDTAVEYGCDKKPKPASCNGDKTDDSDSSDQNPVFDFPTGGTHQVKLTVEDNNGETDDALVLVNVVGGISGGSSGNPDANVLKAELKTEPMYVFEGTGDKKKKVIHVPADSNGENVTLSWGDSRGSVQRYEIDKNLYCDSTPAPIGNGVRDDDTDNPDTKNGSCTLQNGQMADHCWTTNYQRFIKTGHPLGAGHFTTRLKVIDAAGKVDTDSVDIVFDGPIDPAKVAQYKNYDCNGLPVKNPYGASLFEILGLRGVILLSLLGGVGGVLFLWGAANVLRRGKQRNV